MFLAILGLILTIGLFFLTLWVGIGLVGVGVVDDEPWLVWLGVSSWFITLFALALAIWQPLYWTGVAT